MKKFSLLHFVFFLLLQVSSLSAQVTTDPQFPTADAPVTIIYDATQGASGLENATNVYMHAGVILSGANGTDWTNVVGNWGQDDGLGKMTQDPDNPNRWRITLTPRSYFNVPAEQPIYRIGMVFREGGPCGANGLPNCKEGKSTTGGDIFVNLFQPGLQVSFTSPTDSLLLVNPNATVAIAASASEPSTLSLYRGTTLLIQVIGTTLNYNLNVGATGEGEIRVTAENSTETREAKFLYVVKTPAAVAAAPAGTRDGINYRNGTSATLQLFAPGKESVYVIGDFNNWRPASAYLMNRTPDGNRFWLDLTGLTPGEEYAFQYLIDGNIRVGDPYTEKILDPLDRFISNTTYPNLKSYPAGKTTGPVSVLQTDQTPYNWQVTNFQPPQPEDLVIYELLVRDFVGTQSYTTLADTLTYLKRLGVNAVELMPIMEFAGNDSWGYNPIYYLAPDKAYGTKYDLKAFIDKAHSMGIAVILDMVLNQADYEFPYVKMYWDGNQPAANNPFFNQQATHPFSVFFDFNHESPHTKAFVDSVSRYWLEEYKFDGFRYDLSKGFTQKNTGNDVEAWSALDESRIAIWKRIYDRIRSYDSDAYVILEHLAVNEEEKILADYGMLLWGNMQPNYKEAALGYDNEKADLSWASYQNRNWNDPHLIAYMESHDEERLMVEQLLYGNENPTIGYSTKALPTALDRMKLASAFYFTIPGPKMIWQFGEMGYDLSINRCPDGSISEGCRTAVKPTRWEYLNDQDRTKLFKVYAELNKLKTTQPVFRTPNFTTNLTGYVKRIQLNGTDENAYIIGNFGVDTVSVAAGFQQAGTWYDHFSGATIQVADANEQIVLQPGEFHLFTTEKWTTPEAGIVPDWTYTLKSDVVLGIEDEALSRATQVYPNPTHGRIRIGIENGSRNAIGLRLTDLLGRTISRAQLSKQQDSWQYDLNMAQLAAGVYLLEITDGTRQTVKRIMKE